MCAAARKTRSWKLTAWQLCFLATALLFGLQLSPTPGVFLMVFGAAYWSIILINLGFALMVWEAWKIPARRWLIIFPLIWFGGYLIAAWVSHRQAGRYIAEMEATNASKRVAFDPLSQDLVIDAFSGGAPSGDVRAKALVENYDITRVYEDTGNAAGAYDSFTIVRSACANVETGERGSAHFVPVDRQGDLFGPGYARSTARNLCILRQSMPPRRPAVIIRPQKAVGRSEDGRVSQSIKILGRGGKVTTLRSGWARPLTWLPKPMIGCYFDIAAPAWRCFARFARESAFGPRSDSTRIAADSVVAKALGLRKAAIRERYPDAGWN